MEFLVFILDFIAVGIPTIVFYGTTALFGWLAIRAALRDAPVWRWALYALLAVLPLTWFGTRYAEAFIKHRQLDATVLAARDLPRLSNPPRTLVVHAGYQDWQSRLVEMG